MNKSSFRTSTRNSLSTSNRRNNGLFGTGLFGPGDYGDSIGDAKEVGKLKLGKSRNYSGDVGGDDLDFFEIEIDNRGEFKAKLDHRENDGDPIAISLLNRNGQVVRSKGQQAFKNIEPDDEGSLSVSGLAKGKYYVRIQSDDGDNESYRLRLSLNDSNGDDDDDDDSSNSDTRSLGKLTPGRSYNFTGRVGGSNRDLYNFNVDKTSRVAFALTNDSSDDKSIAFSVLNSRKEVVRTSNGRTLFDDVDADDNATLFASNLESGNYSVRVQSQVGSNEPYKLRITRSQSDVTPL